MIQLIIALIVIGVLLWVVESLLPLDATIKRIIQVVVILAVLLYICRYFGVL